MNSKNNSEKRCRQKCIAARKRRERSAYREKYKEQNRQGEELSRHNRELESGIKKAEIWFFVTYMWTLGMFVFLVFFVGLWSESVFLNWLFSLLFIGSAFMVMQVFANFMSRCYFYISLGEFPSVPCGIRIPVYFVDWVRHRYLDNVFEEMNKDDVFTHCSAKQIVLTNKGSNNGDWLLPGGHFSSCCIFRWGVTVIFGHLMCMRGFFYVWFVSLQPCFYIFTTEIRYL